MDKLKQKFWTKTGFMTKNLEEMVSWIVTLTDENVIFMLVPLKESSETTWYIFRTNANTYVCNSLIEKYGFHDAFPIMDDNMLNFHGI